MKILYLTILSVFFCQLSLAQLTVRNDAYIFATDIEVYVEDDVNLTETNSTFYLRDEAQLIQGPGNTGNSGVGKLSVYQEGTVNQYAYNYWASPVGNVDANSTGNRAFTPNKNIYDVVDLTNSNLAGYSTTGYNGTSSPLNIEDYWIWTYNPGTNYSDWDYVGESGTVDAGYGFTMKGTDAGNQQYDFRGKPNEGEILVDIEPGQETLIGNPYPSALDAALLIHDPANSGLLETATLYYWEQDQSIASHNLTAYSGGYASYTITDATLGNFGTFTPATFKTYNADGTINTISGTPSSSIKEARRFIPIGQGFMIKGNPAAPSNSHLLISDSHRVFYRESAANSEFFRTAQQTESTTTNQDDQYTVDGLTIVPADFKRFRLNIDFNETYTRQLLQNFHNTATPNEDYGLESRM